MKTKLVIAALFVAAFAVAAVAFRNDRCQELSGTDVLSISVDQLGRGDGAFFCYKDDAGRKIRFVLARGADGKIRSVFDACRQCYSQHKGYALSGGDLVCRACGNRYPIDRMMTGKASCVPVSLPHQESSGKVEIKVADLNAGKGLF